MKGQCELPIDSWPALTKVAEEAEFGDVFKLSHVYRGHEDASWKLTPSLHRAATNDGRKALPSPMELLKIESYVTTQFRANAPTHLHPSTLSYCKAESDWWSVMRHYGVPTRILDWTASFYVAAYFAASRLPDKDGVIYAVRGRNLDDAMKVTHPAAMKFTGAQLQAALIEPSCAPVVSIWLRKAALTDRMIVQQGLFMYCHNVAGDVDTLLQQALPRANDGTNEAFRRYIIPAAIKPIVMRHLRRMNITASSLFPGLDGIGRYLDEMARIREV